MTLDYRVVPLTNTGTIEGVDGPGRYSDFTASWPDTLAILERELDFLDAEDVVFELDVIAGQLTTAGRLRSRSKAASRAVRISFETPDGPMHVDTAVFLAKSGSWLGDSYMRESWQHNVRALALGLSDLRRVSRYGMGRGKQYAGYKAIGAGSGAVAMGGMTRTEAESIITGVVGAFDRSEGKERLRRARAMSHPDRHGGDQSLWDRVEQAARVLGLDR